jgi:hypothetical protein
MNSCELVSAITAISCAIAKCVPKDELPVITSIFGQLASTLATITVMEETNNPPLFPTDPAPSAGIITVEANSISK